MFYSKMDSSDILFLKENGLPSEKQRIVKQIYQLDKNLHRMEDGEGILYITRVFKGINFRQIDIKKGHFYLIELIEKTHYSPAMGVILRKISPYLKLYYFNHKVWPTKFEKFIAPRRYLLFN